MKQTALLMAVATATLLACNQKADTAVPGDDTKVVETEVPDVDADADAENDAEPASDAEEPTADEPAAEDEGEEAAE